MAATAVGAAPPTTSTWAGGAAPAAGFAKVRHSGPMLSRGNAFDDDEEAIYFRMGFAPASQKRKYLERTDHVSFVVYADTDDGWKSVVVEGTTETLGPDSLDAAIVEAMQGLDNPYYQVHERPATDVEFRIVRVDPTRMSGIVEGETTRTKQPPAGSVDDGSR